MTNPHNTLIHIRRPIVFLSVALLLFAYSCKNNDQTIGLAIRPDMDRIDVFADTFLVDVESYMVPYISAQADTMVLGEFFSPTYGSTKASLFLQFAAPDDYRFPAADYRPEPDSLVLLMYYNDYFGSAYAPLEFSVYEMNRGTINYSDRYFSNLNPGDYTDSTILMGRRVMTSVDLSRTTDTKLDSAETPYVRYRFNDEQTARFFNIVKEQQRMTTDDFLQQFRGMYITTTYGNSTILYLKQVTLYLYYHYTYMREGHDTIVKTSIAFPANHEVRQLNRFTHPGLSEAVAAQPDTLNYIKSMAGLYPKIRIPYNRIRQRFMERVDTATRIFNISAAELTLECAEYDDIDVFMDPPTNLLAISTDSYDDFIRHNTPPLGTETDRVLGTYSAAHDSYVFDFTYLLSKTLRDDAIDPDSVFEFILMPVDAVTSVSTGTGDKKVSAIRPLVKLAAVKVFNSRNQSSPLRLKILYDSY